MKDDTSSPKPGWNPKTRIGRGWFIALNLLSWAIVLGAIWLFVFRDPAYAVWAVIIAILLTIVLYVLRVFRMNDISADTQKELWKSGNMMWAQGWLLWIAPSSSSKGGSLWEASTPVRGKQGVKVMGRNFLGIFIVSIVLFAISFGVNHFLSLTPTASTPVAQNPNQEGPRTAYITLALGDNESTTLSVAVPAGYIGNDASGDGAIIPDFSRDTDTPNIQFSSQPATQSNLNSMAQQVVLDSDTNQEYFGNQPPATAATGTFLGYPAWFITATNDRPAKTIVFQVGSSTNMIEIQIVYSPGDPASEHQQVDGILNSIEISSSSPAVASTTTDLTIKEWGVQFQKPAGMDDLEYMMAANGIVGFSTGQLQSLAQSCSPANDAIGVLTRSTNGALGGAFSTSTSAPIDGYYYYFTLPNGVCSQNSQAISLQGQQSHLLIGTILQTLQAVTSTVAP